MIIRLLKGVKLFGRNGVCVQPAVMFGLGRVREAAEELLEPGVVLWVTSFCEGKHSDRSLHQWGWACDFDFVPQVPASKFKKVVHRAMELLGESSEYQIIYEPPDANGKGEHGHLEVDPPWGKEHL